MFRVKSQETIHIWVFGHISSNNDILMLKKINKCVLLLEVICNFRKCVVEFVSVNQTVLSA